MSAVMPCAIAYSRSTAKTACLSGKDATFSPTPIPNAVSNSIHYGRRTDSKSQYIACSNHCNATAPRISTAVKPLPEMATSSHFSDGLAAPQPVRMRIRVRSPHGLAHINTNLHDMHPNFIPNTIHTSRSAPVSHPNRSLKHTRSWKSNSSFTTDQPNIAVKAMRQVSFEEALCRGFQSAPQLTLLIANGLSDFAAETLHISFTPMELR
ncbi:hypothetical protein BATDEDRAFT_87653 [Batrachochytrium dendrobatidis JAM81]|uniref:Uncharacterized protein n=2 Tax=Batrachochytrium dendrobatidis TaxID=109871 RepID=F4P0N9_BATDJ|nr:uncharacterized protein BATDEDRAFT_87653 [Batrachochytrium dendrobatidis JAM81]EGF81625.1 hypothetical protein BATDEDRAFT_87653 [Batrachochytrium dendrobatidis JAM81]KAJ8329645.1 hypothetical protein O5D80_002211 [Batrachochytrium dendrobatidis]KAK5669542.1 hypothetical protein QVD99_003933 [Batrachochytrium dendrobatidis]OAJ38059.1 hypothetical protein BDEG_22027 [Batrachochytrium dendrobatidis JEL423]|eukprot:XP_006678270.1 hypothetical protein BATDEDRAFT_87653 [Batrachochytrium dendrobatidis JAM81]